MANRVFISAEPELLSRNDEKHGRWVVENCPPERGLPNTDIVGREMHVPMDDDEVARCIRAHEVMHAKVSPGTHWPKWIARGYATERAMRVVEEARVNHLCHRAGIPVKAFLTDGKERANGERIGKLGNWDDAVYNLVAMVETAALPEYIKGIKKHKPEWVKSLKAIARKIERALSSAETEVLASTEEAWGAPAPYGFFYTERLAMWLDTIASLEQDVNDNEGKEGRGATGKAEEAPISPEEINKSSMEYSEDDDGTGGPGYGAWGKLNVTTANLSKSLPGSISRKRKASPVGRNPRRIHRMLTDPERRIFDTKSRGKGGIVLIDASGSMHFSEDDIYKIVSLAPGALVAMYAEDHDGSSGEPNLHILAKNGKMVSEIPGRQTGNNVDLPALEWAVAQRTSNKTPVIWVSDGEVTAIDGNVYPQMAVKCALFCQRERVIPAPHIGDAIRALEELKTGRKPAIKWPSAIRQYHKLVTGKSIA